MNRIAIGFLACAAFLAPIYGGQLPVVTAPGGLDLLSLREPQHCSVAHLLIGVLAAIGYLVTLVSNKVVQTPTPKVFAPLVIFGGTLLLSLGTTDFRILTLRALGEWLCYLMLTFAIVASVGRGRGIVAVLSALVAGCAVIAADGILEYASMRSVDPTWRIFAGWINPNALAGILGMGFVLSLSLIGRCERVLKALPIAAGLLIGLALLLTQSKGGYLAAFLGVAVFFVLHGIWDRDRKALVSAAIPVILVLALGFAVRSAAAKPGQTVATRLESAGGSAEQSVGYRQLLWKGAAKVSSQQPFGLGLGTFGVESGRSGLHEPAYLAHQSYLQLAQEAGWLGIGAFLWIAVAWVVGVSKGASKLTSERATLLAGVVGAVVSSGIHNFIDSGWYHFGIGATLFLLLGLGLQLAADGSSPEFFPAKFRSLAGYGAVTVVIALLAFSASIELAKAAFLASPTPEAAGVLTGKAGIDDEAWVMSSRVHPVGELAALQRACDLAPSAKNWRRLARAVLTVDPPRGEQALNAALRRGPNNLQTLLLLMNLQIQRGSTTSEETYRRILEVEKSPYYQVRAIPELVVTEAAEARLDWLAAHPGQDDASTLQAAVDILLNYAKVTAPRVMDAVKKTGEPFGGEGMEDVTNKMARGKLASQELAAIYRKFGEEGRAKLADEATVVFGGFGL